MMIAPSVTDVLDLAPKVRDALAGGRAVVALESTIITHGMPYPENVEAALAVEAAVREGGAVPATIALIGGRIRVGLSASELDSPSSPPAVSAACTAARSRPSTSPPT
jgi:pseudouridylate synthase